MSFFWFVVGGLVLVMWVVSVVDIVRRGYPTPTAAAWICLVVLLPFVGSIVYWALRKTTPEEAEAQRLAEADRRRTAGDRPFV